MNILFVSQGLYPCKIGGMEIFNYYLIKELSKSHNIYLITNCNYNFNRNIHVFRTYKIKPGKFFTPLQNLLYILKLREKTDIIHLSYTRGYWLSWIIYPLLKKLFKMKYLITIHGGGLAEWNPVFPYQYCF